MGLRDRLRLVLGAAEQSSATPGPRRGPAFAVIGQQDIDPALFGLSSYASPIAPAARVSRREAMQVPAVKRARDLIVGTCGGLPLFVLDEDNRRSSSPLLEQPEPDIPRSVTMARTYEDLLFEGTAFWRIIEFGPGDYPLKVRKLDYGSVDIRENARVYYSPSGRMQGSASEHIPDEQLIRFYSPNEPLLVAAARAIRTSLLLDAAAARQAQTPYPMMWLEDIEGTLTPDEKDDLQAAWKTSRETETTAILSGLKAHQLTPFTAEQMQLADSRQHQVLEIARATGIDAKYLSANATGASETYANSVDKRMELVDFTLSPFVTGLTDRLAMDDVTTPGYRVRADYSGFVRANEAERMTTYTAALQIGAYDIAEVARREELPTPPPRPAPQPEREPQMIRDHGPTFSAQGGLVFDHVDGERFAVDEQARTITGLALPYGKVAASGGRRFTFGPGSVRWSNVNRVKLLRDHDNAQALGRAVALTETPEGLVATLKVARTPEGDRALALAADGVLDGLSIRLGDDTQTRPSRAFPGVLDVVRGLLREITLTAMPAFDDARLSDVRMSLDGGTDHDRSITMSDALEPQAPAAPADAPADISTIAMSLTDAIKDGFASLQAPQGRPVIPAGTEPLSVREESPYRFDGRGGQYDFSADLIANGRDRDGGAGQRVLAFMGEAFANIAEGDVNELNPTQQRPDMYVDQSDYEYPIWTAINKGTRDDRTPFEFPKYNSSSGLVADHVAGTEPTEGAFTTTSQTVTPTALSGKAIINREVWDMGGNPQLSGLLWRQMERSWFEALEAKAVSLLNSNAASITDVTLTTAGADAVLEGEITAALAALQYIRGGLSMRDFFVQVDLYNKMVAAKDTTGRKLFPVLGPTNATGTTGRFFSDIMVGGLRARPAWALAASGSVAANSWLFNREFVHGWASAPRRLDFEVAVASVQVGIWGYVATAITDFSKIRQFVYDPV